MRLLHPHLLLPCCFCHILRGAPKACALRPKVSTQVYPALVMQGMLTASMVRAWPWHQLPLYLRLHFWPTEYGGTVQGLSVQKQDAI